MVEEERKIRISVLSSVAAWRRQHDAQTIGTKRVELENKLVLQDK